MKKAIAEILNVLLADYQVLYQKLRNYHWNVRGPRFFELHAKFEELYREAAERVDELAERILALGGHPASTLKAQLAIARLTEDDSRPDARTMVAALHGDLQRLNGWLREAAQDAGGDQATVNLLDAMADAQEKTAWMLRAFMEE